ncbi:hypothetical protein LUZ60_011931 [Juncus effusus]|nr:hypothetical protein LUZ60_011931 [Juncus effusus]
MTAGMSNNTVLNVTELQQQYLQMHMQQNLMRENQILQNQIRENQILQNQMRENQIPQNQIRENQIPQNQMRENQIPQNQMRENQSPQNIVNSELIQGVASSSAGAQTGALSELELEEMFEKVKSMKEQYFTDSSSIYERLLMKLNQIDQNLVADVKAAEQIEKMKSCKNMLDQLLNILQLNKQTLQQHHFSLKDKLHLYEQQIMTILQNTKAPQPPAQQPGQTGHSNNIPTELTEKSSENEIHPIERLAKALLAGSNNSGLHGLIKSAVTDIYSVARISDRLPGSAPGSGSRSAVRSDLAIYLSKRHLPDGNRADQEPFKKMKWDAGAVMWNDDDEFCGEMRKTEVKRN